MLVELLPKHIMSEYVYTEATAVNKLKILTLLGCEKLFEESWICKPYTSKKHGGSDQCSALMPLLKVLKARVNIICRAKQNLIYILKVCEKVGEYRGYIEELGAGKLIREEKDES